MISGRILGIGGAVIVHAGILAFGGILLPDAADDAGSVTEVELFADEQKKDEQEPKPDEQIAEEVEPPPDAADLIENIEPQVDLGPPALDAASLASLTQALGGGASGGDFADALSLASGGRIGGTGKGGLGDGLDDAFSLAEIDQKPRAVFQSTPLYPSELRRKKLEAVVTVVFIVDASGKVARPSVEKSTHPAFEKPALEAVKQWKFEPAVRAGKRVPCKMRVPIRFQPS